MSLHGIDIVVLAGGQGTRLRSALDEGVPKVLAPVAGRPFLAFLLDWLDRFGAGRIVLCLGYRADRVTAWLAEAAIGPDRADVSIEPRPLGTAGALAFARGHLRTGTVLVINGDTFADADLIALADAHCRFGTGATMLCTRVEDSDRYGRVELDEDGRITEFVEKAQATGPGLINAGLYLFDIDILDRLPRDEIAVSLERELLPSLVAAGRLRAHVYQGAFLDIGTPESLALAENLLKRLVYSPDFYAEQRRSSAASAQRVLPHLFEYVRPTGVIDIGCGVATWAGVCRDLGVAKVTGVDGDHVPRHLLEIPREDFIVADLARSLTGLSRADLVLALEVAEHLPPERAPGFIADLTTLGDVVLFSAALPFQGGTGHLNEDWLEYWAILFRGQGFVAVDALRPAVWNDLRVCWWYRQNLMLFVRRTAFGRPPLTARLLTPPAEPPCLSQVHPAFLVNALAQSRAAPITESERVAALRKYTALLETWQAGIPEYKT